MEIAHAEALSVLTDQQRELETENEKLKEEIDRIKSNTLPAQSP